MPAVSALLSSGVSVGLLAGVVSGLLYLVVAGLRWAGEAKQQKSQWLYRQARGRFLPAAPADGALEPYNGDGMEPDYVKVREFIERLVESMVLGELDNVCIKRLHAHPEYKHMAEEDSPSAAHAALKQLVQQIVRDAMTLPNFRGLNHARDHDGCQSGENIDSKTYEDILATAILNKVIERYQESSASNRTNVDGNSNLLTPELMSLISTQQPKFISSVEIGVNSTRIPDDVRTVSSDECEQGFDPLSLTIEECIEEVTTVSNVEDDDNDLENDELGVDIFKSRRTPFPEYGRDIIDGLPIECPEDFRDEDDEDNDEVDSSDDDPSLQPTDVINPVDSWEKNWLFQKRRLKVGGVSQSMPVPMLVPNPSEDYRALIGDRDAEEVSDLSECSDGALEDLILAEDDDSSKNTLPSEVNTKDVCAEWIAGIQLQAPSNSPVCESNTPLDINQFSEESNSVENTQSFLLDHTSNVNSSCDDMDITEAKNIDLFKTPAEDCLSEFGQQEGEYTEDYAAVTQRQLDSLSGLSDPEVHGSSELPETPVSQQSPEPSGAPSVLNYMASTINENLQKSDVMDTKTELEERPKAGTIAEREHKKWESAPPLPNNPYSSENIYKRLNKKQPYASVSNGNISDASVEFPEVCGSPTPKKVIDQPMHIVCSPSDVDYKRYGRDYYINTAPSGKRQSKSSSLSQLQTSTQYDQEESLSDKRHDHTHENGNRKNENGPDYDSEHELRTVETKVAHWQKEINETNEYYQSLKNKKQDSQISSEHIGSSSIIKSVLSDVEEENEIKPGSSIKHMNPNFKEHTDKKDNNFVDVDDEYNRNLLRENRMKYGDDSQSDGSEQIMHILNKDKMYDTGKNILLNGSTRSNSPSGSSVLTSDGEYSMPSVRELKKRFSSIVDSDSSTSSKSSSPAPKWRNHQKEIDIIETRVEAPTTQMNLNAPKPTREIHSLTARSISREFREELRHNQPIHLNRNVYRQPGKFSCANGSSSETTMPHKNSQQHTPPSPLPVRSMQSSIAFWEKLQNQKL